MAPEPYFSWGNALFEEAFDSALRGSTPRGGSLHPIFCEVSQSAPTPPTPQNIGELSTRMQALVPFCSNQAFAPIVGRRSPILLVLPRRPAETALSPRWGAQFWVPPRSEPECVFTRHLFGISARTCPGRHNRMRQSFRMRGVSATPRSWIQRSKKA